jgi:ribosomal protein S18 acetylase RimI-like enzyme
MKPKRAHDPYDWPHLLVLITRAFAGMEGRIDPPSSLHHLTAQDIAQLAISGEIWVIGAPAVACVFLTPLPHALYLGKLAVDPAVQRMGYAGRLLAVAESRARALALPALELSTRIELTENHAIFRSMGFVETATRAHDGFDRPTTLVFTKYLAASA